MNTSGRSRLAKPRRRIPLVAQLEAADCGAACLAMVMQYFGSHESVVAVRDAIGASPVGITMHTLLQAATDFGLRSRAVRTSAKAISTLPRGTILHWEFNHFVVLDGVGPRGVCVVDPGVGHRTIAPEEFARSFTGLALCVEPSDAFARSRRGRSATLQYLGQMLRFRGILGRILAASAAVHGFGIALPALTGVVVDRVIPRSDHTLLWLVAGAAGLAIAFNVLAFFARSYAFVLLRARLDATATASFVEHMLALPYAFFQRRSVGDLMLRVHSNTSIREILSTTAISAVLDGTMVTVYAVAAFAVSPAIASALLVLAGLQVVLILAVRPRLTEQAAAELHARAKSHSELVQILTGVQTIKSVGAESEGLQLWGHRFADELNAVIARDRTRVWTDSLFYLMHVASPFVILLVGTLLVMDGGLSLGTMLALSALSAAFLHPVSELVRNGVALFEVHSHLERVHDVLSTEPEQPEAPGITGRIQGRISLHGVSFRYDGHKHHAIREIDLEIEPGQHVAVVGPSGCGKSTLSRVLLGLYPPTEGTVRYDGRDLQGLPLRQVRRMMGVVPQKPFLFENSIRNNIALTRPDASLDEVRAAARLACVDDEINAMFAGYDTRLAGGGESVSGGQRQRLALARALLAKPKVLILDEATSALDTVTEAQIVRNLERLRCTRVVIAHRLSTIVAADKIVLMNEGRIVGVGTHDQLVNAHADYRRLLSAQLAAGDAA